jgi:hypothetical protein
MVNPRPTTIFLKTIKSLLRNLLTHPAATKNSNGVPEPAS